MAATTIITVPVHLFKGQREMDAIAVALEEFAGRHWAALDLETKCEAMKQFATAVNDNLAIIAGYDGCDVAYITHDLNSVKDAIDNAYAMPIGDREKRREGKALDYSEAAE